MPKIGANFVFDSTSPNFKRDRFDTLKEMRDYNIIDDGHQSYCAEDGNRYEFKSSNTPDATLGKWRLVKTSVDIASTSTAGVVKISGDFDIAQDGTLTLYKALSINSFSITPNLVEAGSSISSVTGNYTNSKVPASSKVGVSGSETTITPAASGDCEITGTFTSNTTFRYQAKDSKQDSYQSKTANLTFGKYAYKFESDTEINPDAATVKEWTKGLATNAVTTHTMAAQKYFYYAVPSDWTLTKYIVGGFDYTWTTVNDSLSITTDNNTTTYKVVRTAGKINSSTNITIS